MKKIQSYKILVAVFLFFLSIVAEAIPTNEVFQEIQKMFDEVDYSRTYGVSQTLMRTSGNEVITGLRGEFERLRAYFRMHGENPEINFQATQFHNHVRNYLYIPVVLDDGRRSYHELHDQVKETTPGHLSFLEFCNKGIKELAKAILTTPVSGVQSSQFGSEPKQSSVFEQLNNLPAFTLPGSTQNVGKDNVEEDNKLPASEQNVMGDRANSCGSNCVTLDLLEGHELDGEPCEKSNPRASAKETLKKEFYAFFEKDPITQSYERECLRQLLLSHEIDIYDIALILGKAKSNMNSSIRELLVDKIKKATDRDMQKVMDDIANFDDGSVVRGLLSAGVSQEVILSTLLSLGVQISNGKVLLLLDGAVDTLIINAAQIGDSELLKDLLLIASPERIAGDLEFAQKELSIPEETIKFFRDLL
jgi:hypothetical protein